jgi:UDP-N-acetylglucosamine:LPS N-acetylglucosamine transferase
MSGGWGIGPVAQVSAALGRGGYHVLAVAGTNQALEQQLRSVARDVPNVVPFGYVEDVARLMVAADVVVTSSGDTCREVRAIGRPMVLLDVVPGHGRENLMHEVEMGDATIAMPTQRSVVGMVEWTFANRPDGPPAGRVVAAPASWFGDFADALRAAGAEL